MHEIDDYSNRFSGIQRLVSVKGAEVLRKSHIAVIGVGGVGSWVVEALARTGIGQITMVDLDEVCINNTNRQLHALDGEVGKAKVDSLKERIVKINPACQVNAIQDFFTERNAEELLSMGFDYVVDAIDSVNHKCLLLYLCRRKKIPVISCGGAGGRIDPTKVAVKDFSRTHDDPLLAKVRKELRQKYNFPKNPQRRFRIECVYSWEEQMYPASDGSVCKVKDDDENLRLDCESGYGTASFLTGTFGFIMASRVIIKLLARYEREEQAKLTEES